MALRDGRWLVLRGGRWWWRGFGGPDGVGVVVVLRGVGRAAIVAARAGAEGVSSREFRVGAGASTGCRWFR